VIPPWRHRDRRAYALLTALGRQYPAALPLASGRPHDEPARARRLPGRVARPAPAPWPAAGRAGGWG